MEVANPFLEDQEVVVEMIEDLVMLKEVEVSYLVEMKFLFTVLASGEEVASNS